MGAPVPVRGLSMLAPFFERTLRRNSLLNKDFYELVQPRPFDELAGGAGEMSFGLA